MDKRNKGGSLENILESEDDAFNDNIADLPKRPGKN